MEPERIFVVVMGADQKGIIAKVSGMLFEHDCNIIDVQQKVMDGTFVMTMLADITDSTLGTSGLRSALEQLGQRLGLTIMLHNEAVIKSMHQV